MSTYQELKGLKVKYLSSDTSGDRAKEGEVFYNSKDFNLKSFVPTAAWHSSAPLISARRGGFGAGTLTAGLAAFGRSPTASIATSEEYNGTGWTAGGTANTARFSMAGSGTQTAAVGSGGYNPPGSPGFNFAATEEYDGSSWTSTGDLSTARSACAGFGIQTAAVNVSGYTNPGSVTGAAEHYNGSSWTAGGSLNTTTQKTQQACGTQTAGLAWGGDPPGGSTGSKITEEYNGSSWTASNNTNIDRSYGTRSGTQTAAVCAGGYAAITTTETYDGTSWSTSPATMATGRRDFGGADGSDTSAFACGGNTGPAFTTATEEFSISISATTGAAWASIANFPDSRAYSAASGGTPTSTLVFGGYTGPGLGGFVSSGAEFNGSSWTATGDYVIDVVGVAGLGPITAGLGCGGYKDNATNVTTCAEYDGSSWTSANSANAVGQGAKMAGVQTAASMGNRSGDGDGHEQYDGTNWTSAANTPISGNAGAMMAGTQSALLMYGAESSGNKKRTELFDGSSWTSGNSMSLDRRQGSHGGTQTYAIAGGGDSNPGIIGNTELWDGTSWASSANMGTARFYQVGGFTTGSSGVTSNIAATGRTPGSTHSNNCEEFTGETTAVRAAKTIDFD